MDINQKIQAHIAQSIGTIWLEAQRNIILNEALEQRVKELQAELDRRLSSDMMRDNEPERDDK